MNNLVLKLDTKSEENHYIYIKDIAGKMQINIKNKEINNLLEFFRLVIFKMFIDNKKYTLSLSNDLKKYDDQEVIKILEPILTICNSVELDVSVPEKVTT